MKNLALFFALLFVGWSASANSASNSSSFPFKNYGESFIFVEGGVEFAVYPNGEFDFYYNPQFTRNSNQWLSPRSNISYNSGYNYDPYLQYDDYGAVTQIENVPVYYDFYGRITQAGRIDIDYNRNGLVSRVGGLNVRYNSLNRPINYVGYINNNNRRYVYQPWHKYYARPMDSYRVVYYQPYRSYYEPVRMNYGQYVSYYKSNKYHYKNKKDYYRPQNENVVYHNGRRTSEVRYDKPVTRSSENIGRRNTNTVTTNSSERVNRNYSGNKKMERSSDPRNTSRNEISNSQRVNTSVRTSNNVNSGVVSKEQRSIPTQRNVTRERDTNNTRTSTSRIQESKSVTTSENVRTSSPQSSSTVQRGRSQGNSAKAAERVPNTRKAEAARTSRSSDTSGESRTASSSRGNIRRSEMK